MTAALWGRWVSQVGGAVLRAVALVCAGLVINNAVVRPSAAQIAALPAPEYAIRDENNVDLLSFHVYLEQTDLVIGAKEVPLAHTIYSPPDGGWAGGYNLDRSGNLDPNQGGFIEDTYNMAITERLGTILSNCLQHPFTQPWYIEAHFANTTESFKGCVSFTPLGNTGSTLVNTPDHMLTYTKRDGTAIVFDFNEVQRSRAERVVYPDGRVLTYWYCTDGPTAAGWLCSVTRSDGLQLKYNWGQNSAGTWQLNSVVAINNAYEYCNPTTSVPCPLSMNWPTATYARTVTPSGGVVFTVTDGAGRVTRYTEEGAPGSQFGYRVKGIMLPSGTARDNITYNYCDANCPQYTFEGGHNVRYQDYVLSVIRDGQVYNYSGNPGSPTTSQCGVATYGVTNPVQSGKQVTLVNCLPDMPLGPAPGFNPLIQMTDEDGVLFKSIGYGLINPVIKPEGNQIQYTWDTRRNLTQEVLAPKPGSPLAQVTLSANYDTTCTVPVKCNKPNWVKDGLQNETDYTYDPAHGGVLTATLPPDANGIRPQTRYTYTQRYAWVRNSSGAYVQSAAPVWVLATESFCRTSAAAPSGAGCTQAGDEVVKTYEYGPDSGPNNLFLRGFAVTADGATHRTCYGYDPYGHKISQTEPKAALASCP